VTKQDFSDLKNVADAVSWETVGERKYRKIIVGKNVKSAVNEEG
jgi:hypothetical protein